MHTVKLREVVMRAHAYERMAVPFSPALHAAAWLSIPVTALALIVFRTLPGPDAVADWMFFLVLRDQMASLIDGMQQALVWLCVIDGLSIALGVVLLLLTRQFTQGEELLHGLACVPVAVGAGNAFVIVILLTIVAVNAALWAAILGLILSIVMILVREVAHSLLP